jgi:ankyrin repeat protein
MMRTPTALMFWRGRRNQDAALLDSRGRSETPAPRTAKTPLMIAASRAGAAPVAKLLLDHGANPSVRTPRGATPLTIAANAGDADPLRC